ncbi:MAG: hypothetical protein ACRDRW_02910 [Pseudonocardiaceae bacterium]
MLRHDQFPSVGEPEQALARWRASATALYELGVEEPTTLSVAAAFDEPALAI